MMEDVLAHHTSSLFLRAPPFLKWLRADISHRNKCAVSNNTACFIFKSYPAASLRRGEKAGGGRRGWLAGEGCSVVSDKW